MELRYTGENPEKEIFQVFGETMEELFKEDSKVVYLDADLMGSLKTQNLWKNYPKNVFNCGIQESNMVGVAAGLFLAGFKPYIHTFTPFATRRVFDQAFLSVGYANKSVRIIGSDSGIMATHNGGTHMCFEDVAIMRTVPNACVIDITDGAMLADMLKKTKDYKGLVYIRTARRGVPDIYPTNTEVEIGQGKILKDGSDCTIVASGIMVATALQASEILSKEGISVRVVDIVTVKPIDIELLKDSAKKTGCIVTAENHNVIGGLGSAVCEYISENCPVPVCKVGVQDQFGQVGNEPFLREQYKLTSQEIVNKVKLAISLKGEKL